ELTAGESTPVGNNSQQHGDPPHQPEAGADEDSKTTKVDRKARIHDNGRWTIAGQEIVQTSSDAGRTLLAFSDPGWDSYDLTLEANTDNDIKVCFDYRDDSRFRMIGLEKSEHAFLRSSFEHGWGHTEYKSRTTIEPNRWYSIQVEVRHGK